MSTTLPTRPLDGVSVTQAAATDDALRASVGYRVVGRGGELGVVAGVPEAGLPPRPLVLVIRAGDTFHFLSVQRVERVLPSLGELLVRDNAATIGRTPTWALRSRRRSDGGVSR